MENSIFFEWEKAEICQTQFRDFFNFRIDIDNFNNFFIKLLFNSFVNENKNMKCKQKHK